MITRIAGKTLRALAGKKKHQKLFEQLYQLSLAGMNVGGGSGTESSGEQSALELINQRLKGTKDLIIFDVGANVGNYSNLLNTVFGDKATIFSFEPSKKTFASLISNTSNLSNVKPFNFGLGDEDSQITLFTNADESGMASVYRRNLEHFGIEMNKTEEIEIRTIDTFCSENNIEHIHLLKLDVEGHEIKVLKGASSLLKAGNIDYIQFEFGGCNIDSRTYFQDFFYLLKDNYTIYRIVKDGLYEVEQYKEMYEVFITTNFIAERRN